MVSSLVSWDCREFLRWFRAGNPPRGPRIGTARDFLGGSADRAGAMKIREGLAAVEWCAMMMNFQPQELPRGLRVWA